MTRSLEVKNRSNAPDELYELDYFADNEGELTNTRYGDTRTIAPEETAQPHVHVPSWADFWIRVRCARPVAEVVPYSPMAGDVPQSGDAIDEERTPAETLGDGETAILDGDGDGDNDGGDGSIGGDGGDPNDTPAEEVEEVEEPEPVPA